MIKKEIQEMAGKIKKRRTATLQTIKDQLNCMIQDRRKTNSMWFWGDNGNCAQRSYRAKFYNVRYEVELYSGYSIHYKRNFSQSRANTYANDYIWDTNERDITVADLKKLVAEIDSILACRTGK